MTRNEYRDQIILLGLQGLSADTPLCEKASYMEAASDAVVSKTLKTKILKTANHLRAADKAQLQLASLANGQLTTSH